MTADNKANKKAKLKIKSWYSNRYQIVLIQRNVLLLFTLVSMFSVAIAVIFVKTIMSSKSLEPYVIEIEEKTGVATIVDQMTTQKYTGHEMVRKYFINEFIQASFSYDSDNNRSKKDSNKVRVFSSQPVYKNYTTRIKEYGSGAEANVRIKTILFTGDNNAQVRIVQQVKKSGSSSTDTKHYLVDITFYLAPDTDLNAEDRLINPLGFQVSKINITEEII